MTLADLGRLVVFNAQLQADDVPTLVNLHTDDVLDPNVLPADARLDDCDSGSELYERATSAYDRFRLSGIQKAKRSKLLHLKRPWLVPIHDSRTDLVYRQTAIELGEEADGKPQFWEAFRLDLVDGVGDLT